MGLYCLSQSLLDMWWELPWEFRSKLFSPIALGKPIGSHMYYLAIWRALCLLSGKRSPLVFLLVFWRMMYLWFWINKVRHDGFPSKKWLPRLVGIRDTNFPSPSYLNSQEPQINKRVNSLRPPNSHSLVPSLSNQTRCKGMPTIMVETIVARELKMHSFKQLPPSIHTPVMS